MLMDILSCIVVFARLPETKTCASGDPHRNLRRLFPTVQAPTGAMHFVMVCFVIVWNDQCCEEIVLCYLWFVMLVCTHVTVCHVVVCYDMAWYVSDNMMSYIYCAIIMMCIFIMMGVVM